MTWRNLAISSWGRGGDFSARLENALDSIRGRRLSIQEAESYVSQLRKSEAYVMAQVDSRTEAGRLKDTMLCGLRQLIRDVEKA